MALPYVQLLLWKGRASKMHGLGTMFWNAHKSCLYQDTWESTYNYMIASAVPQKDGLMEMLHCLGWSRILMSRCDEAQGETCVLILDRHSSHYMPELLEYAQDNDIMILGYPPHCTHALQGWRKPGKKFNLKHSIRPKSPKQTSWGYLARLTKLCLQKRPLRLHSMPLECTLLTAQWSQSNLVKAPQS